MRQLILWHEGLEGEVVLLLVQVKNITCGTIRSGIKTWGFDMTRLFSAVLLALTVAVLLAATPPTAKAWGRQGHLTVCDLAYRNLTAASRAALVDLMQSRAGGIKVEGRGRMPDRRYTSFNVGCLEEDALPRRHPEDHFINVDRTVLSIDSAACPRDGDCILSGIDRDLAILRNPARPREERVFALMALGHWLGDIHQPLHVSFADDRGGNGILVPSIRCGRSTYRSDNLHSVWDACILEAGLFDRVRKRADFRSGWGPNTISYRAVDTLMANTSLAEERAIIQGDPQAWANESYQIALAPETLYCTRVGAACRYSETAAVLEKGAPKRVQAIGASYLTAHDRRVEDRVRYAGFRLAHLLNQALDPAYAGPVANGNQAP